MQHDTQIKLNTYLNSVGLDPADAVYGSLLDITYLMPDFIARGGTYCKPTGNEQPVIGGTSTITYPTPIIKVEYGSNWLLLKREIRDGYPVIRLLDREDIWGTWLVHPDHLDTALCYLLKVHENAE